MFYLCVCVCDVSSYGVMTMMMMRLPFRTTQSVYVKCADEEFLALEFMLCSWFV